MNPFIRTAAAAAFLLVAWPAAHAAPIQVYFEAQSFTALGEATPPQDPVIGSFLLQHDSAADFTGEALNPTLVALELVIGGVVYDTGNTGINPVLNLENGLVDFVQIGGTLNGFGTVVGGTNDFLVVLTRGTIGAPSRLRYSVAGILDIFTATNTSEDLTRVTYSSYVVPLPATGFLLLTAVALFGGRAVRRREILA